jgi:O-acetyl-ADP-ribose deacetylase (regulator of RNase III)
MKDIIYLSGDATYPRASGNKVIAHICNDKGAWGGGFVLAISNRWSKPEILYKEWVKRGEGKLGSIQFVPVEEDIVIANMIAQKGFSSIFNPVPLRYEALRDCLKQLSNSIRENEVSVHMPRIGCGIAKEKWEKVEPIIKETLCENDIQVYVYDL